jgi:hypothetical protein
MRSFPALMAAVTLLSFAIEAVAATPALREGDRVTLAMSGDVAKQYMKKTTGEDGVSSDVQVSIVAKVAECFPDGGIRIESVEPLRNKGKQERLLTISAIVRSKDISTATIPKGTRVHASPADQAADLEPGVTTQESLQSTAALADLKEVTIRSWVLEQD